MLVSVFVSHSTRIEFVSPCICFAYNQERGFSRDSSVQSRRILPSSLWKASVARTTQNNTRVKFFFPLHSPLHAYVPVCLQKICEDWAKIMFPSQTVSGKRRRRSCIYLFICTAKKRRCEVWNFGDFRGHASLSFFFLFLRCPISFLMPFNPICVTLCVGRWRRKTSKLSKLKSLKVHAVSGYGEFIFCSNKFCCSFFCGVHHILSRTIVKQRWRLE